MFHIDGGAVSREVARGRWLRIVKRTAGFRWCVHSLDDARFIGHAMINPTQPDNGCEISYILAEAEWGKGYATEIAKALVVYSRDRMGLGAIYGTLDEGFEASINVSRKAGLKFLGYDFDDQGRYLVYVMRHREEREIV